jgi:7-carboxy-7-deazaguanine synthase
MRWRRAGPVAVETNGTQPAPAGLDWICVSPKAGAPIVLTAGHELKLVYPQNKPGAEPEAFEHLDFESFRLQPLDDERNAEHAAAAVKYCLDHPQWSLSLQTHKTLGIA